MFDLLRVRPARRAAYSALEPFVHRVSAYGPLPQAGDWLHPQILGFLATVVTLIAERKCGELQTHALASVQSSVLNQLTGIGPELIGEEICLLSSRRDPAFAQGSIGALAFLDAMDAVAPSGPADMAETLQPGVDQMAGDRKTLDELWNEHVERFITRTQPFA